MNRIRSSLAPRGWTVTELLVAIVILAMLATLSFPAYRFIRAKLDDAACKGNLKALHAGFSVYLQDHNMVWPQIPEEELDKEDEDWTWWFETLRPYGITRKTWVCPADRIGQEMNEVEPETLVSSYAPTTFDDVPNTAYRWNTPWLIERGQNHGRSTGPNMVMPNGEVIQGIGIPQIAPE